MGLIMMQSLECGVDGIRKFLVLAFVMIVIVTTTQVDIGAGWTACRQQNGEVYWYHLAGRSMSRSRPTEPDLSLIGIVDFLFIRVA